MIDLPDAPKFEFFDYPGEYVVKGAGDPVTKVRMEEEEAGYDVVNAASRCTTLTPGGKFTLQKHDIDAENGDYLITSVRHAATEMSYGSTANGSNYNNLFTCIPASVLYRPPRTTPKPMVQGVADRRGDRAAGRGDLRRQVRSGQGPVLLGPQGQEGRQELVLDPRLAGGGRQGIRRMVIPGWARR